MKQDARHVYAGRNSGVLLGVHISEMDLLTIGTRLDMYSEMKRDDEPYAALADQDDFDKF